MGLKNRISSQTPKWFKKVIGVGLTLATVGTALLTAETQVPGFELPQFLERVSQWFIVGGLVAAAIAKTAKESE